jgi:hypothetical protein
MCGLQDDTGRIYPSRNGRTYVVALMERDVLCLCGRVHDEAVENTAGAIKDVSSADENANVLEATNGGEHDLTGNPNQDIRQRSEPPAYSRE